jgi:hypothetical protein
VGTIATETKQWKPKQRSFEPFPGKQSPRSFLLFPRSSHCWNWKAKKGRRRPLSSGDGNEDEGDGRQKAEKAGQGDRDERRSERAF